MITNPPRARWWRWGLKMAALVALAVAAVGTAVMLLWNAVLPGLTGWAPIGFWQAVGLLLLARILTGGLRGGWGARRAHWRARMAARWNAMSDEERERFRAGLRQGCGRFRRRDTGADRVWEA